MNMKSVTVASVILIAASAIVPLYAQNTGFLVGTIQPQNPAAAPVSRNPVQGMTTPPVQGMTTNPVMPMGGAYPAQQIIAVPQFIMGPGNRAVSVLPAGGTIFVPAGTVVIENGLGMQPGAFLSAPLQPAEPQSPSSPAAPAVPNGARGRGASVQRTDRELNIQPVSNPQSLATDSSRLALGTPREKVIEKYGNPVAFIMNMNGETLYFNGGAVVFVKDGVVASPTNQDLSIRQ